MRKANTKIIKENISLLNEQKRKCFDIEAGIVDFKVVQETCREMDILLLPLYFVWEHMFKRNLCEVQFELHLTFYNYLSNKKFLLVASGKAERQEFCHVRFILLP